jgi:predicted aminopeptidase
LGSLVRLFGLLWILSSCQASHLLHVSYNHLSLLSSREPIEKVLQSPKLTEEQKKKIKLTQEVKKFAYQKLKLKESANYSHFVDLGRRHVVYNLTASERWKFEPYLWSFPIIGKAPYKGFYNEEMAKHEVSELEKKGFDAHVGGVSAYSTLGYLNDPLLSSMLYYSDYNLANTIIHELVHTHLFIKNNINFNERLAVFVANKGTEMYYLEKEGPNSPTLKKVKIENEDDALFSKFITNEIEELKKWYSEFDHSKSLPPDEKEMLRSERLGMIAKNFNTKLKPLLKSRSYDRVFDRKLNNAYLINFNTYMKNHDDFESVYAKNGANIPQFLKKCEELLNFEDAESEFKKWAQN